MSQEDSAKFEQEIERLKKTTDCNLDFACTKPDFDIKKHVKQEYREPYPKCLRTKRCHQNFFNFGSTIYCKCPLMLCIIEQGSSPSTDESTSN